MGQERNGAGARAFRNPLLWFCVVFWSSRVALWAAGVRLDDRSLGIFMHFLDPELLRDQLAQSLFYLHVQPPLFNLFLGLVLKAFGASAALAFQAVLSVMAWLLGLATYSLQARLGVSKRIAFALTVLFVLSPSFICAEHLLLYTMPCAALLGLSAWLLAVALGQLEAESAQEATPDPAGERLRMRRFSLAVGGFFLCLMLLCGIRTAFHLGYFVLAYAAFTWLLRPHWRRVLLIGLIPLLVVFSFYAKNYLVFGRFTVCTWSGKHLWIKTVGNLPFEERARLVQEGAISELSLINRFANIGAYPARYQRTQGYEGIPALTEEFKSSREFNYNHIGHIAVSEQYGRDAAYVFRHYPKVFLLTTIQSTVRYCLPVCDTLDTEQNLERLRPWRRLYGFMTLRDVLLLHFERGTRTRSLLGGALNVPFLLTFPALIAFGVRFCLSRRPHDGPNARRNRIVVAYLCFNIVALGSLGIAMEILETARMRFMTDPLYLVLLGLALQRLLELARSKRPPAPVRE